MATRLDSPAYLASRVVLGLAMGVRLGALIPIPLGIAIFFMTPSYTTELLRSPMLSTIFLTFPALWIVFLGPALVVLLQHPS